jgi:hypothetical protein
VWCGRGGSGKIPGCACVGAFWYLFFVFLAFFNSSSSVSALPSNEEEQNGLVSLAYLESDFVASLCCFCSNVKLFSLGSFRIFNVFCISKRHFSFNLDESIATNSILGYVSLHILNNSIAECR